MNISREDYINKALQLPYIIDDLQIIVDKLKNNERVIFTKFGDGEYIAMRLTDINNHNCDGDIYTYDNGIELRKALCELSDRSSNENIYIGRWITEEIKVFYNGLYYDYLVNNNKEEKYIPWVDFQFVYPDEHIVNENKKRTLFNLVKAIQDAPLLKIVMSNIKNKKHQLIFKSDTFIEISESSWYAHGLYNDVKNKLIEVLDKNKDKKAILLTSIGLCSKILINDMTKMYPNLSAIDIGSAFDILSRKYPTRGWGDGLEGFPNCYKNQLECFKELLPHNYDEL
jgi:hypothetical protein